MTVVTALLRYDYGDKDRGISLERRCFFPAIEKAVERTIPFWLEDNGYPDEIPLLQERLLRFIDMTKPDVVFFILMSSEITIETLRQLSKKCVTANWFCDDQWRFENFSRIVSPALTFAITTDKFSVEKYRKAGCSNTIHSQWAAIEYSDNIRLDDQEYSNDICFVGSMNPTRRWTIAFLQESGFSVACFGSGWANGRVAFEDIKEITLRSRINLNLSNSFSNDLRFMERLRHNSMKPAPLSRLRRLVRGLFPDSSPQRVPEEGVVDSNSPKNVEQIKARNFEIPAFGGFQLSQYCLEIEDYFEIGREIAIFSNVDDLVKQLGYYLSHDSEREAIRRAGYLRARDYTYDNRMREILNEIRKKAGIS